MFTFALKCAKKVGRGIAPSPKRGIQITRLPTFHLSLFTIHSIMSQTSTSNSTLPVFLRDTWGIAYSIALALIFTVVYFYIYDMKVHMGGDNAEYYVLAKAIADGKGYVYAANASAPAHNHFPPGYPFLMAVMIRLGITELTSLTAANGLFLLASVLLLFHLFRRFSMNVHVAFVACVLVLLNYHVMQFSTIMMSEIPYLLTSTLALWCLVRMFAGRNWWYVVGFVLCLVASFYIRTAGLSLVAGTLLYLLLRRQWLMFGVVAGGFFLLVLPWQIRSASLGGSSYLKQLVSVNPYKPEMGPLGTKFLDSVGHEIPRTKENTLRAKQKPFTTPQLVADIFTRLGENSKRYLGREIPAGCLPYLETPDPNSPISSGEYLWGLFVLAFIGVGVWWLPRYRLLFLCYLSGSFAILLLWPDVWFGVRFVLPLLPLLIFFAVNGFAQTVAFFYRLAFGNATAATATKPTASKLPNVAASSLPKTPKAKTKELKVRNTVAETSPPLPALHETADAVQPHTQNNEVTSGKRGFWAILAPLLNDEQATTPLRFAPTWLAFAAPFAVLLLFAFKLVHAEREGAQAGEFAPSLDALHASAQGDYEDKYKNYFEIAKYCKDNLPKDAIICCRKQGLFYLFAERPITGFKQTQDKEDLINDLRQRKVSYVVLDQLGFEDVGRYLYPAIAAHPEMFPIIKQVKNPDTYLLQFKPDATPALTPQ